MRLEKENIACAGDSWDQRNVDARSFLLGQHQKLRLKREPNSEWGSKAIAVIGIWSNGNGRAEAQLGYVPEKTAAEILLQFGLVAPHYAFPRAQTTAGHRIYPKIRFDVWAGDFPKG